MPRRLTPEQKERRRKKREELRLASLTPEQREQRSNRLEYNRAWQEANREKVRATNRQWYADNVDQEREKRRERTRALRGSNPEAYNAYMREWRAKNIERVRAREKIGERRRQYGLTEDQYQALLMKADGKCDCCGGGFNSKGPQVDHCHVTGRVRGILCCGCNTSEGLLKTSANVLKLYEYMKRNE